VDGFAVPKWDAERCGRICAQLEGRVKEIVGEERNSWGGTLGGGRRCGAVECARGRPATRADLRRRVRFFVFAGAAVQGVDHSIYAGQFSEQL
jgi:hypothetical protein